MTEVPTVYTERREQPLRLDSIADVVKFADLVKDARGAIPTRLVGKPGEIIATVLAGSELGVGPMAALRAFHVVEGKPHADYSFWIARLKRAGYKVEWPLRTAEKVTLKLTATDGTSATETWDKERAIRAGLWNSKDNWKKYPETMLSARCVTSLGRAFAGEVMFGAYEMDEMEEVREQARVRIEVETGAPQQAPPPAIAIPSNIPPTATTRLAAAVGQSVDDKRLEQEAMVRQCAEIISVLQLAPVAVAEVMKRNGIMPGRLPLMPLGDVTRLRDALAKLRDDRDAEEQRADGQQSEPDPEPAPDYGSIDDLRGGR